MAYGVLYEFHRTSTNGADMLITISQKDYSGEVKRRALGRAPVIKRENKDHIYGTSCELYAECLIDGEFSHLYTSDAYEYKVEVYKNNALIWTGYVSPELYSEPDIAPPYDVQIIATDGLGELKNFNFEKRGLISISDHLSAILSNIGIDLNLNIVSSLRYVDKQGVASAEHDVFKVRLNMDHEEGNSCYDVLQNILAYLNANLTQYNGRYLIFRETDFINRSGATGVEAFSLNGDKTYFPVASFGSMRANQWWPVGQLSTVIEPAKNKVALSSPNHYKENTLDFNNWSSNPSSTIKAPFDETENAYILSGKGSQIAQTIYFGGYNVDYRLGLRIKARNVGQPGGEEQNIGLQVTVDGRHQALTRFWLTKASNTSGRALSDYLWSNVESQVEEDLPTPAEGDTSSDAHDIDVVIPLYRSGDRSFAYAQGISFRIINLKGLYDIYIYDVSLVKYEQVKGYKANVVINNSARESESEIDLAFSAGDQAPAGGSFFQTGIPIFPFDTDIIDKWRIGNSDVQDYLSAMAYDYSRMFALPKMKYSGVLNVPGTATMLPLLFHRDGTYYFPKTFTYDLYADEITTDLISISAADVSLSSITISQTAEAAGTMGTTTGGPSSGGGSAVTLPRDKEMSDTSDNAVENRVIKAYVDENISNLGKSILTLEEVIEDLESTQSAFAISTNAALDNRYTKAEIDAKVLTINEALANRYTKTEIDTKVSAIDATITTLDNKYAPVKTWYDNLANIFFKDGDSIRIKSNLIVEGNTASGGVAGGGGSASVALLKAWSEYNALTMTGYALSAGLGYELHERVSELELNPKVTATNIVNALGYTPADVASLGSLASKDSVAWAEITNKMKAGNEFNFIPSGFNYSAVHFNYRCDDGSASTTPISQYEFWDGAMGGYASLKGKSFIVNGGTSSQFLKADGSLDSTAYLPLAGGTISGAFGALTIKRHSEYASGIKYENTNGVLGYLGFNGSEPYFWGENLSDAKALIHTGNVGDYALKTDGSNRMTAGIKWEAATAWDVISEGANKGLRIVEAGGTTMNGAPSKYAIGLAASSWYGFILAHDVSAGAEVFKLKSQSMSAWKTIAFTDSNLVTSAGYRYTAYSDTDKLVIFGLDTARNGYVTYVDGQSLIFRANTSTSMLINSYTNVTIGGSDLAGSTHKLYVDGTARFTGLITGTTSAAQNLVDASGSARVTLDSSGKMIVGGAGLSIGGFSEFGNIIYANAYGNGSAKNAAILINKGGDRFGIGPSSTNTSNISFGVTSDIFGTWKSEFLTINSSGKVIIGTESTKEQPILQIFGTASLYESLNFKREGWNYITVPSNGGALAFNVGMAGLAGATKMLINNSGDVTIGGSDLAGAASVKFYVEGNIRTSGEIFLNHGKSIRLRGSNDNYYNALFTSGTDLIVGSDSPAIRFGGSKMLINSSGNVGIGTTNPQYNLDVAGTANFSGAVTMASTLDVASALTVGGSATFNNDVRIKGNLIVEGNTASGGSAGTSTIGSVVTFAPSYASGLSLGSLVINGVTSGIYAPTATSSALGVVKAAAVRTTAISAATGGNTSGRFYGVEVDSDGKMFVNVPWVEGSSSSSDDGSETDVIGDIRGISGAQEELPNGTHTFYCSTAVTLNLTGVTPTNTGKGCTIMIVKTSPSTITVNPVSASNIRLFVNGSEANASASTTVSTNYGMILSYINGIWYGYRL